MQAEVSWVEERCFKGISGSGHSVVMDGPPDSGGRNRGVRPMEMLLLGLGGCAAFDVVDILDKGRVQLAACTVRIDAERAPSVPAVFQTIHLHFIVSGNGLTRAKAARAVELSAEKYCSGTVMLARAGVAITHSFELEGDTGHA